MERPGITWHIVDGLSKPNPSGRTWACMTGAHRYHRDMHAADRCQHVMRPFTEYCPIISGQVYPMTSVSSSVSYSGLFTHGWKT